MERSNNNNEGQQSFRSPPRRRRSTFFERRDSILLPPLSENIDQDSCKQTNEGQENYNPDMKYYEKLLAEKEQWKKEANSRRNRYHDLRQQYQMATKAPGRSRMSYAALSKEDIEFLNAKINLSKLVESQLKLHKSVKETIVLHKRAVELDNVILGNCEDQMNKVTEYILENSTIE